MNSALLVVDVDRAVRRGRTSTRLRARYAVLGDDGSVHAVTALDGEPEARRLTLPDWRHELDRLCRVPGYDESSTQGELPDLPWDLLVGTGRALTEHRPDVYDELLGRADPRLREPLRRLHGSTIGRLRVVGTQPVRRRVTWVSWVLCADGWRALTPYVAHGPVSPTRMVRIEPRRPEDLAVELARWAVGAGR